MSFRRVAVLTVILFPLSARAQGYSLNGASLGTNAVTVTIPKSGNAQAMLTLRLQYSGGGASCTTGSLAEWWSPTGQRAPVGVTMGYTTSGMGLPGIATRGIAINVDASAQPTKRQWTIKVPAGSCQGSNQTATVDVTLVKAP